VYSGTLTDKTEIEQDQTTAMHYAPTAIRNPVRGSTHMAFPVKVPLLSVEEFDRKGQAKKVLVACGDNLHLARGYLFDVFKDSPYPEHPIAHLKVTDTSDWQSTCSILDGEAAITEALSAGESLIVISSYKLPSR